MLDRNPEVGYYLKLVTEKFKKKFNENLKESGITFAQFNVLIRISFNGGLILQKDLEKELRVSHPTTVGIVQRLEKAGYVTSYIDENNKRNKFVCITDKANEKMDIMDKLRLEMLDKAFGNIPDDDFDVFVKVAKKVLENLE